MIVGEWNLISIISTIYINTFGILIGVTIYSSSTKNDNQFKVKKELANAINEIEIKIANTGAMFLTLVYFPIMCIFSFLLLALAMLSVEGSVVIALMGVIALGYEVPKRYLKKHKGFNILLFFSSKRIKKLIADIYYIGNNLKETGHNCAVCNSTTIIDYSSYLAYYYREKISCRARYFFELILNKETICWLDQKLKLDELKQDLYEMEIGNGNNILYTIKIGNRIGTIANGSFLVYNENGLVDNVKTISYAQELNKRKLNPYSDCPYYAIVKFKDGWEYVPLDKITTIINAAKSEEINAAKQKYLELQQRLYITEDIELEAYFTMCNNNRNN